MSRLRHPFGHQPPDEREDSKVFFQSHASVMMRWIGLSPGCGGQRIVCRSCRGELLESESRSMRAKSDPLNPLGVRGFN